MVFAGNNHPGYWIAHQLLSQMSKYSNKVVFRHPKRLAEARTRPTLFFANHSSTLDAPRIQLSTLRELADDSSPRRIIRTVMADDIYLDDISWKDGWKNFGLNLAGQLSGQILMKRKLSKNRFNRRPTTSSITDTLGADSHVLLFPMGSMSLDGRVDFFKDNENKVFDQEAYEKIRSYVENFWLQPLHYVFDSMTGRTLVTAGDGFASNQEFDYLDAMRSATVVTPLQLVASYQGVCDELNRGHSTPKTVDQIVNLISLLEKQGVEISTGQDLVNDVYSAVLRLLHIESGREKPVTVSIDQRDISLDDPAYLQAQIAHMNVEDTIRNYLMGESP